MKEKKVKLTKHEKNKEIIAVSKNQKDDTREGDIKENNLSRTFICRCGCEVKLHGNIDLYIKECTQCSKEK